MSLGSACEKSDDVLYQLFLQGDTASYDALMIRYGDRLTFYLHGYIHDLHEAEDLMIEAFARIMAKRPKIGEGAFKAYLFKTARNLALRHHERRQRMQTFSIDGLENEIESSVFAAGDKATNRGSPVEEDIRQEERRKILHLCLDRIDPELKEALWLIYFEDMSYADAAAVMKVNKKKIDHLLQRGKKNMRDVLAQEGVTNAYE